MITFLRTYAMILISLTALNLLELFTISWDYILYAFFLWLGLVLGEWAKWNDKL